MKAIVALTSEEHQKFQEILDNLKDKTKGTVPQEWFTVLQRETGYAHYRFRGKVSEKLVDLLGRMPTPDEVIMLVDHGFSHFGASCTLSPSGEFTGQVYVD